MANSSKKFRQDRIDHYVEKVRQISSLEHNVLPEKALRHALDGILNKRTGNLLASAPTFRDRPLASLLYRHIAWHRGSGNLGGIFSVKWDADLLVNPHRDWEPGSALAHDAQLTGEMTSSELHDRLETTALIMTNGQSPAADRWRKALHGS